jgi:hypothetical protein
MLKKYLCRFGGLILSLLLLPGFVALLSTATAEAQQRRIIIIPRPIHRRYFSPWWGYRRWDYDPYFDYYSRYGHYVFSNSENAFDQGYRDGVKTGEGDAKHNRTFNPQRSHYFQEAGYGNFGEVYRSGFLRGYGAGFRA